MTSSVQHVLEEFQRLTPDGQREAASVILRRLVDVELPPLDDKSLAQIADESFQVYDVHEASRDEG